jgi:hypothetical protein
MQVKWNIFARNLSIIKSRNVCYFAVVPVIIMQTLNWTNQCPLFMTVHHIFEISEDDHPSLVTHARDIWWTLDSANAFVSSGVNSRGELVPSQGASRRRLGDNSHRYGKYMGQPSVDYHIIPIDMRSIWFNQVWTTI